MAIKFNGEFEVKKKPDEVYDFLTNPEKFASLLPEFQGLNVQDATHFTVKVNVGISYIKGTAEVKMQLAEAQRPSRAQYKGRGSMAGAGSVQDRHDLRRLGRSAVRRWTGCGSSMADD